MASAGWAGVSIRVAGALSGVVTVSSLDAPVSELKAEIARLLGAQDAAASIKLIASGRTLQDDAKALRDCGISASSRVLVTRGAAGQAALSQAEQQQQRLGKLKSIAEGLAGRGDGRGLTDDYEFSLENQEGTQLQLQPEDRKAVVMGLALHEKGKRTMAKGDHGSALQELLLAEEAFALADAAVLANVDNVGMLLIDIVWCCYKLQDISRLGVCKDRLVRARQALQRSHGPNMERARVLHGNFCPELAIYVKLEVLEGIVAFHTHEHQAAAQHLRAAEAQLARLQVSDASLAMLQDMGYTAKEATRALRFCNGDVAAGVTFLTEQRAKAAERQEQRRRLRKWHNERGTYGKTSTGAYVHLEALDRLCLLGYDRALAAEALRAAGNEEGAALDVLCDPVRRSALQLGLVARQIQEAQEGPQDVDLDLVQELLLLGFKEPHARRALRSAHDSLPAALELLEAAGNDALQTPGGQVPGGTGDGSQGGGAEGGAAEPSSDMDAAAGIAVAGAGVGVAAVAAVAAGANGSTGGEAGPSSGHARPRKRADAGAAGAKPKKQAKTQSDEEMEDELVRGARKDDPMAAYDMALDDEAEAIQLYLSMLGSVGAL